MSLENVLIGIFAVINIVAFLVIGNDKRLSRQGGDIERIPEGFIFFMAVTFGGIGVYLGMFVFRHKTRKWYFQIGIPLLILQNLATLYFIRDIFV